MKFGMTLAGMALTLLGATTAQAQLTITLNAPITDPNNAAYTEYFGTITNTIVSDITVDGDNIGSTTPLSGAVVNSFIDTLGGATPAAPTGFNPATNVLSFTVPANGVYVSASSGGNTTTPLFELNVPAGTPLTDLTFSLSNNAGTTLGSVDFTVGTADVPEPGSVALLASSLVGGSLLMARRRRK